MAINIHEAGSKIAGERVPSTQRTRSPLVQGRAAVTRPATPDLRAVYACLQNASRQLESSLSTTPFTRGRATDRRWDAVSMPCRSGESHGDIVTGYKAAERATCFSHGRSSTERSPAVICPLFARIYEAFNGIQPRARISVSPRVEGRISRLKLTAATTRLQHSSHKGHLSGLEHSTSAVLRWTASSAYLAPNASRQHACRTPGAYGGDGAGQ